jgi:hypothetical protein
MKILKLRSVDTPNQKFLLFRIDIVHNNKQFLKIKLTFLFYAIVIRKILFRISDPDRNTAALQHSNSAPIQSYQKIDV